MPPAPGQPRVPFGNLAEGAPKQAPGEDVLGRRSEAASGSRSGGLWFKDWPARFPLTQGHSAGEEILTENELSGKKAETFIGMLLS